MKTDELIAVLATNAGPAAPSAEMRLPLALGGGGIIAIVLMSVWIGVRGDIGEAMLVPMFWLKLAFPVSLAVLALVLSDRLAHPGILLGRIPLALLAPVLVIWFLAAGDLLGAAGGAERAELLFGATWKECPVYVSILSLPAFAGLMWALRGLAPVRPALAGAAAGLLAGAVGATAYALHCPEMEAPFLGVWYLLGMLIPACAGAIIGARILRW